jgi:DNA-binding GntR family transcriptional regulator
LATYALAHLLTRTKRAPDALATARACSAAFAKISPYFHLLHASDSYFKAKEQHEMMLAAMRARDAESVGLGVGNDIEAADQVLVGLLDAEGSPT